MNWGEDYEIGARTARGLGGAEGSFTRKKRISW
jgi:hypothetical protein